MIRPVGTDQDRGVVAPRLALLLGQLGIAEIEADPELLREIEQRPGLGARHLALEIAVDLRLVGHPPAREERRQRQLGKDDEPGAPAMRLAHHRHEALHHRRAVVGEVDRAELRDGGTSSLRDIGGSSSNAVIASRARSRPAPSQSTARSAAQRLRSRTADPMKPRHLAASAEPGIGQPLARFIGCGFRLTDQSRIVRSGAYLRDASLSSPEVPLLRIEGIKFVEVLVDNESSSGGGRRIR